MFIKRVIKQLLFLNIFLFLAACSGEGDSDSTTSKQGHVWKEQTDTINTAKQVEGMLMDSATNTRNMIDQQEQ